jgi:hypothetical protein
MLFTVMLTTHAEKEWTIYACVVNIHRNVDNTCRKVMDYLCANFAGTVRRSLVTSFENRLHTQITSKYTIYDILQLLLIEGNQRKCNSAKNSALELFHKSRLKVNKRFDRSLHTA